jgi:hypothetical protein
MNDLVQTARRLTGKQQSIPQQVNGVTSFKNCVFSRKLDVQQSSFVALSKE